MTKLLIIGDLHGRKPKIHFKKNEFDAIVFVGDVCDDRKIGPLFKKFFKKLKQAENPLELSFGEFIEEEVGNKKFEQYEKDSLKKGNEILKYLDSFGKPIFMVAGNWDQSYGPSKIKDIDKDDYSYMKAFYDWWLGDKINAKLTKGTKNVRNCMYKNHLFNGINFIGYGLSSGSEKRKKGRKLDVSKSQFEKLKKAYNKILRKLSSVFIHRNQEYPTIFITHNIPYNTKLDKIDQKGSHVHKKHMGSTIARKICKIYKPLLCVGGHIHEGRGRDKIGKTKVINPGFGQDAQVLVDIDGKKRKIKEIKFYGK